MYIGIRLTSEMNVLFIFNEILKYKFLDSMEL